jgi:hypothetical protein
VAAHQVEVGGGLLVVAEIQKLRGHQAFVGRVGRDRLHVDD